MNIYRLQSTELQTTHILSIEGFSCKIGWKIGSPHRFWLDPPGSARGQRAGKVFGYRGRNGIRFLRRSRRYDETDDADKKDMEFLAKDDEEMVAALLEDEDQLAEHMLKQTEFDGVEVLEDTEGDILTLTSSHEYSTRSRFAMVHHPTLRALSSSRQKRRHQQVEERIDLPSDASCAAEKTTPPRALHCLGSAEGPRISANRFNSIFLDLIVTYIFMIMILI
eukprot:30245-Pelagococcus_subviridis.AAC.3